MNTGAAIRSQGCNINKHVGRVRPLFRWAVENEYVRPELHRLEPELLFGGEPRRVMLEIVRVLIRTPASRRLHRQGNSF
jgi:hypothetical protein